MSDRVYTAIDFEDAQGSAHQLRVVAVGWKGQTKAHIRQFYQIKTGEFLPDKKGVVIDLDHLPRLIYALSLMQEDLKAGKFDGGSKGSQSSSEAALQR